MIYAGTEPAALYRSEDRGETFSLVRPLWEHPTRDKWVPGGGREGLHTVVTDRRDPKALTVAVSTAGVFRSGDGGASWKPSNSGVSAVFLPDPNPEFGQCVHKVARMPRPGPDVSTEPLGGVQKRRRGRPLDGHRRGSAVDVRVRRGRASAPRGHGVRLSHHRRRGPRSGRTPVQGLPYGGRGQELGTAVRGASGRGPYGTVLRDALCTDDADPAGVYFGNRNGELYASANDGDTWQRLASHLPDVLCVRAAVIS